MWRVGRDGFVKLPGVRRRLQRTAECVPGNAPPFGGWVAIQVIRRNVRAAIDGPVGDAGEGVILNDHIITDIRRPRRTIPLDIISGNQALLGSVHVDDPRFRSRAVAALAQIVCGSQFPDQVI